MSWHNLKQLTQVLEIKGQKVQVLGRLIKKRNFPN